MLLVIGLVTGALAVPLMRSIKFEYGRFGRTVDALIVTVFALVFGIGLGNWLLHTDTPGMALLAILGGLIGVMVIAGLSSSNLCMLNTDSTHLTRD